MADELEYIKQRLEKMESTVEEEDLIAHVISNLGEDYDQLVNIIGEMERLTFLKLRERIRSYYVRVIKDKGNKVTDGNLALLHQASGSIKSKM